jgi:hypothetical protein
MTAPAVASVQTAVPTGGPVPTGRSEARPVTGEAGHVVFTVLLGSWIVAVTASGVLIPPVPLLVFLLFRVSARRRRPSPRGAPPGRARTGPAESSVPVGH